MAGLREEKIVVGIDGSDSSLAALAWAGRQAAMSGARLEVISAWDIPVGDAPGTANARRRLDEQVESVLGPEPDVEVATVIVDGPPGLVLVNHSTRSILLVVGCRQFDTPDKTLLGSVSAYVATHARCPVVVVHGFDDDRGRATASVV